MHQYPDTEKRAVLLLAFGGADSIDSVEPFVKNVLKGRAVSPDLVEKAKARYQMIGGKSPLLDITKAQAAAIGDILKKNGKDYGVYIGMRYWRPFIKETLKQMDADGVTRVIAIIMAPFKTKGATGGYADDVNAALNELNSSMMVEFVREWHIQPLFIEAVVEKLNEQLARFPKREDARVIFSTHSLPMTVLEGDPYEMVINQTVEEVVKKAGPMDWKVGYQSKGAGPREWMGPSTEEVIQGAGKDGKKGVIVVPIGFVADHVETLYDIDVLFKGIAENAGLVFARAASLNTSPRLMELFAGMVMDYGKRL